MSNLTFIFEIIIAEQVRVEEVFHEVLRNSNFEQKGLRWVLELVHGVDTLPRATARTAPGSFLAKCLGLPQGSLSFP